MSTWKFDYELGCPRQRPPALVPSIERARTWEVKARAPADWSAMKGGMWIHMGNVSGVEPGQAEFEFMQHDPRQDWPEMRRWWRPLRGGILPGDYVFKIVAVDSSTSATLYYDDEGAVRKTFSQGSWQDIYAPAGKSFDSAGGWFIYLGATNASSTYMVRGLFDVFIANDDGFGNPVEGTEILLRWQCSLNRQHLSDPPDQAQASYNQTAMPTQIQPETAIIWAGPPIVAFMREDYQYVYHNLFFYDTTGGGHNFLVDWYEVYNSEVQRGYGDYNDGSTKYTKTTSYYPARDGLMAKFEYVSGDNVLEVNYGDTAMGEWVHTSNLNIAQIIDAAVGEYQSLSGVFDITIARNATPNQPFPYVYTPIPGSEQRRRLKIVTQYVADQYDASNPLPDLSPPYDPDYPVSANQPFEVTIRTTTPGESITLPFAEDDVDLGGWLGVTVTVDWGDGSTDTIVTFQQAEATHTYASPGDHEISITGVMEGWQYDLLAPAEALKLIEVRAWGTCELRTAYHMFYGCSNMTVTATDAPDLTRVANLAGMFYNCSSMTGDFSLWQPRRAHRMEEMFYGCTLASSDLTGWGTHVGNLYDMAGMFTNAVAFNPDLSAWRMDYVTSMDNAFVGSGLTTENYDLLLNALAQTEYLPFYNNLTVDVPYTVAESQAARDYLTGTTYWNVVDGGGV